MNRRRTTAPATAINMIVRPFVDWFSVSAMSGPPSVCGLSLGHVSNARSTSRVPAHACPHPATLVCTRRHTAFGTLCDHTFIVVITNVGFFPVRTLLRRKIVSRRISPVSWNEEFHRTGKSCEHPRIPGESPASRLRRPGLRWPRRTPRRRGQDGGGRNGRAALGRQGTDPRGRSRQGDVQGSRRGREGRRAAGQV